jgi:hypothetical protein
MVRALSASVAALYAITLGTCVEGLIRNGTSANATFDYLGML